MASASRSKKAPRTVLRRGAILVLSAFLLIVFLSFVGLALDLGYMVLVRTEAQRCADAAALAAAWNIYGDDRIREDGTPDYSRCRDAAIEVAALNRVGTYAPVLERNEANAADGDIVIGLLNNPADKSEVLSLWDPATFNAVQVRVRMTRERNQQCSFFFARIFRFWDFDTEATATAVFDEHVRGFRVTEQGPPATLLPFALKKEEWDTKIMNSTGPDNWTHNNGTVSSGADGIRECKLFPVSAEGETVSTGAGNWGTVNFSGTGNSTNVLCEQIRNGVSAADIEGGNGTLDLAGGTISLNGETGMSVGMVRELNAIIGQPRIVPLYDQVTGSGNTTYFRIVAFVGIRIVEVKLTGKDKYVNIQPAYVADTTGITSDEGTSHFIGKPVRLVR